MKGVNALKVVEWIVSSHRINQGGRRRRRIIEGGHGRSVKSHAYHARCKRGQSRLTEDNISTGCYCRKDVVLEFEIVSTSIAPFLLRICGLCGVERIEAMRRAKERKRGDGGRGNTHMCHFTCEIHVSIDTCKYGSS